MHFEWDASKNAANIRKHGIDFCDVIDMFSHPMLTAIDDRYGYGAAALGGHWTGSADDWSGGIH